MAGKREVHGDGGIVPDSNRYTVAAPPENCHFCFGSVVHVNILLSFATSTKRVHLVYRVGLM